jgi:hypothetical protein
MKLYSQNIGKLYEAAAGFDKISVGETYTSKKGNKYSIKEIFIDAKSQKPDVTVVYDFETEEGQKGSEENSFTVFVDMLRNS